MVRLIVEKLHINESLGKPCEGIFWFIDNKLISYMDPVGFNTTLEHKNVWENIKNQYNNVSFDYYPRGRVMVNEIRNDDGVFEKYKVFIYIDDCINTDEIVMEIEYQFSVTGSNCEIVYVGSDGGITSNHYKCHNCK